ncbi:protocatechuate 3,4-dioxygenase [Ramlibacter albus]|uniref:Protocatechuate 3,4-dioxygenase n=1 Tax=Ramlibacter albus TaxID=2079448 RepID=A0A923M5N8_9BURK|nr:protocatechuate 3,4-dioxygenase [Ramlibacter albus]MBC5763037.1 protocatechuate 3,4-dioxygenase [Ramlibacter albus]
MATIVAGFCVPHDPLITGKPDAASPQQSGAVHAAFAHVRSRLEEREVDTVVVIGDDHYAMFSPGCLPSILIGIGDLQGPLEPESFLRIPQRRVPNHPAMAEHIMSFGFDKGFDWAVAKTLKLDHSTMVPIHLAVPEAVRTIPVYIGCGVVPFIRSQRCRELGRMLLDAISAWPGKERVAILGTGGISHWVGMADYGRVNEEFDRGVLEMVANGDIEGLIRMSDEHILGHAGNGALELKNWIVAMSAMPELKPRIIAYEPVEPWITGLGFAELGATA